MPYHNGRGQRAMRRGRRRPVRRQRNERGNFNPITPSTRRTPRTSRTNRKMYDAGGLAAQNSAMPGANRMIGNVNRRGRAKIGSMGSCPPGQHMMPDGTCMMGNTHPTGGYKKGGKVRRMNKGGRTRTTRRARRR